MGSESVTMPDEPTLGEVVRTLARIERDLGTRLDQITARLDRVITVELYEAHQAAVDRRITEAETEIADMKKQREIERQRDDDRQAANRRMIVGALIGAALSLIVTITGAALVLALGLGG